MLKADKLPAAEDLGFVGEIREVNTKIVEDAIASGYTPVISTVAAGYHGEVYNINADVAAARIAAELGARKLILMTDIVGLLRNKDDENTLIPVVNVSDVPKLKRDGIISGGMIPKIDCCVEAVRRGVERAHIIDGRTPHSILVELFTDEGHRHDVLLRVENRARTRERKRRMGEALGFVGDSIGVEDKYGYVFNRVQTILWKQKEF